MSSSDHRGIPQGNAAIVAALIGAAAVIIAATIPVAAALFFGVVQINFPLSRTPTQTVANDASPIVAVGQPTPQPTYTPSPTPKANVIVVTPKPLIITATATNDQQSPLPGSIILAGQAYNKSGVSVALKKSLDINGSLFSPRIIIENHSGQQLIARWSDSYLHVRDDKGRTYPQVGQGVSNWGAIEQREIAVGESFETQSGQPWPLSTSSFRGPIAPDAKYVIFTIDQIAGMTNLNWRYDLQ